MWSLIERLTNRTTIGFMDGTKMLVKESPGALGGHNER